ncbi:hypothetical protein [Microbacterium sp.]|uniref:hypothetical protein n=1 Tax=Microbacterium sp. TaxID=51671 RepID=UPI003C74B17A
MLISQASALLRSRDQLLDGGTSGSAMTSSVAAKTLVRIDRGWYAEPDAWRRAYAEGRHLMRVLACERRRQGESSLVYSHVSAAVLWGLPLWRIEPRRVHVSGIQASGHVRASEPLVARHEVAVPDDDVAVVDGIRCTSLPRTVADLLRGLPSQAALAVADAALRMLAWDEDSRTYDEDAAAAFREEVAARLPKGGRGVRDARQTLALADGRAASPGESASRRLLIDIGFRGVRLQTGVPAPDGGSYYLDFDLEEANAWGEYDGEGKYLDSEVRDGDLEAVLLAEKQREDWIRGTTQRKLGRWMKTHIASAASLERRLAQFHIFPRR